MNIYSVKWVHRFAGPTEYSPHENEFNSTDLHGIDIVTCSNERLAFQCVKMARPQAEVERPKFLGPA